MSWHSKDTEPRRTNSERDEAEPDVSSLPLRTETTHASMYLPSASSQSQYRLLRTHHIQRPNITCSTPSTTMKPARNSRYEPYPSHCQKSNGLRRPLLVFRDSCGYWLTKPDWAACSSRSCSVRGGMEA